MVPIFIGGGGEIFHTIPLSEDFRNRAKGLKIVCKQVTLSVESYIQEVSIMALFRTFNNFAKIVGYYEERLYLFMLYYEMGSLHEWIHPQNNTINRSKGISGIANIISGLAIALLQMDKYGITHNDLKPQNILLSFENGKIVPKVTDFGVAVSIIYITFNFIDSC